MDPIEKYIAGAIILIFIFMTGGSWYSAYNSSKEKAECRKQGLDANKTVDDIVLLCNLPHRRK